MFDSLLILFLPFLLSFVTSFLLSNVFLNNANNLKLEGTFSSRMKRKRISQGAGSIILFCGGSLSLCFIVALGFVPHPIFVKILLLGVVLLAVGYRANISNLNNNKFFLLTLSFAILLVGLLLPHFLKIIGITGFTLGLIFTLGCVYLVRALNLLERTAIMFTISVCLFGSILGVYTEDVVLSAGNFSVLGSLLAFAYFNFSESRNIKLGVAGELLVGLSIASQGLYLFGKQTIDYSSYLPFAFLIFLYPVCDALQYFGSIAINKIFGKNIKVCQIHEHF